jgi:hypothetical protein
MHVRQSRQDLKGWLGYFLTLFQPGGPDYPFLIGLSPLSFLTFRRPCMYIRSLLYVFHSIVGIRTRARAAACSSYIALLCLIWGFVKFGYRNLCKNGFIETYIRLSVWKRDYKKKFRMVFLWYFRERDIFFAFWVSHLLFNGSLNLIDDSDF